MSVAALLALDKDERKKALAAERASFTANAMLWTLGLDAYEGTGGFANGEYLWKFSSELPEDFTGRKDAARYHNFVESLVDLYTRHLFSQALPPQTKSEELKAWWDDVDGAGTSREALMREALGYSLVTGHVGVLVDKTPEAPVGPAKADERARTIARVFPATAIPDWRFGLEGLEAVKLREAVSEGSLADEPPAPDAAQYLVWDRTQWARFTAEGEVIDQATPATEGGELVALGAVPFAVLRTKPLLRDRMLGRALVNPSIIKALFNRTSEEDHILRDQAFSQLVATVEKDAPADAVQETQTQVEANYGVKRVMVIRGELYHVTADMAAPQEIRTNISFLIRELFRAAHVPYDKDSKEAESAEALALKRDELNQMLQALSAALTALELRLAYFWFLWNTNGGAEAAQQAFEAAEVQIEYPREFFLDALIDDLEAWGQALSMVKSETFSKVLQKDAVRRVKPDLDEQTLETIDGEIEAAQPADPAEGDKPGQLGKSAEARMRELAGDGAPKPGEGEEGASA